MTTIKVNAIEPEGATTDLTIGLPGSDVVIGADYIKSNTFKDGGGGYKFATFTAVGVYTWTCPTNVTSAEVFIVAGGGGGGSGHSGGGGGGGGIVHDTAYTVVPGVVYDLTVGAGGVGPYGTSNTVGANGSDSTWNDNAEGSGSKLTAKGGGGGGADTAAAGGSGGGGCANNDGPGAASNQQSAGTATSGTITSYGNRGGKANDDEGGGGGGAGGAGGDASLGFGTANIGGHGGIGKYFATFADYGGEGGFFSGGGGGSSYRGSLGEQPGGLGGGGDGAGYAHGGGTFAVAGNSPNATGGGGGGAATTGGNGNALNGGDGGSGLIVIKYADPTPNTLWTSNGSGVITGSLSDTVLIQTQTFTNQATVSFTSGIDSTYKEYVFEFVDINPATDDVALGFQVNAVGQSGYDETITSTMFRNYHDEGDSEGLLNYNASVDQAQGTGFQYLVDESLANDADSGSVGELHLFNPSSTTYTKQFYARFSIAHWGNYAFGNFLGGYINTTAAIDDIQFKMNSGNFDGTIKMYGIK